jgi:hypothetical protein
VAITNISQEVKVRLELNARDTIATNLFKASKNGNRFNLAMEECRSIFIDLLNDEHEEEQVLRDLHSLKGLFSYYGPFGLDLKVHEIELSNKDRRGMNEMVSQLKFIFEEALAKIQFLLPHLKEDNKVIPQTDLMKLNNATSTDEVKSILMPFVSLDLERFCSSFEDYLNEILSSVQKELSHISVNCHGIYLDMELFPLINHFFIHGLRNSVAHVFTEQVIPGLKENQIYISSSTKMNFLLLDIETRGELDLRISSKEKPKTQLSGQKKGMQLIEQMAQRFGCHTNLVLKPELNTSHFIISIPQKYIRGLSHVQV